MKIIQMILKKQDRSEEEEKMIDELVKYLKKVDRSKLKKNE